MSMPVRKCCIGLASSGRATFAAHINRAKFSSKGMRDFVDVFRANQSNVERPGGLQIG